MTSVASASRTLLLVVGRSLFPLVAIVLLLGLPWLGPWWFLGLTFVWWRMVTWVA